MLSTVKLHNLIGVSAVSNIPKRTVLIFSHMTDIALVVTGRVAVLNAPTMYHVSCIMKSETLKFEIIEGHS